MKQENMERTAYTRQSLINSPNKLSYPSSSKQHYWKDALFHSTKQILVKASFIPVTLCLWQKMRDSLTWDFPVFFFFFKNDVMKLNWQTFKRYYQLKLVSSIISSCLMFFTDSQKKIRVTLVESELYINCFIYHLSNIIFYLYFYCSNFTSESGYRMDNVRRPVDGWAVDEKNLCNSIQYISWDPILDHLLPV